MRVEHIAIFRSVGRKGVWRISLIPSVVNTDASKPQKPSESEEVRLVGQ
jgi:hypothetical protein